VAIEKMEKGAGDCGCELGGRESKDDVVALHQKAQERICLDLVPNRINPDGRKPIRQLDYDEADDCDITKPGCSWSLQEQCQHFAAAMPEERNRLFRPLGQWLKRPIGKSLHELDMRGENTPKHLDLARTEWILLEEVGQR
jgi:hypothetical protein